MLIVLSNSTNGVSKYPKYPYYIQSFLDDYSLRKGYNVRNFVEYICITFLILGRNTRAI
jgi:hypothetical protein